jgi:hypothetical protein
MGALCVYKLFTLLFQFSSHTAGEGGSERDRIVSIVHVLMNNYSYILPYDVYHIDSSSRSPPISHFCLIFNFTSLLVRHRETSIFVEEL